MADEDDDDLTPEEEERFTRFLTRHNEAEAKKTARAKPPKNFAEALDRISDAVIEKLDARAEARRKERDAEDEEPERGGKPGGFLGLLTGSD